jgi:hypothetical protein
MDKDGIAGLLYSWQQWVQSSWPPAWVESGHAHRGNYKQKIEVNWDYDTP